MNTFFVIARIISAYSFIIWVRIILTWLPSQRDPYHADIPIVSFIKKITDPFLAVFKSSKTRAGSIDFSPLLALMVLNILQSICLILARSGSITVFVILGLIIQELWHYFFSFILILLCIALLIRYICGKKTYNPNCTAFLNIIDPIITKPVNFVVKLFYPKKKVSDQTYVLTAFIFYVVLYIAIKQGLAFLVGWLSSVKI